MDQIARTPKQVGNVLRRERHTQALNQTELAQAAGLRQELVSKIESGNRGTRLESICALLAALDLELVVRKRSRLSPSDIEDIF